MTTFEPQFTLLQALLLLLSLSPFSKSDVNSEAFKALPSRVPETDTLSPFILSFVFALS